MIKKKARGLVIKDNQILLICRNKHGDAFYAIPGGGAEDIDTSLEDTVVREVLEETSVVVKPLNLLTSSLQDEGTVEQSLFLCKYVDGEATLGDSVELAKMTEDPTNFYKPMWVDLESAMLQVIKPGNLENFVKDYIYSLISETN